MIRYNLNMPELYSKISDINIEVIEQIAKKYDVSISLVEDCWDSAQNWLEANGKRKKNYKAFLSNWVKSEKNSKYNNFKKGILDVSKL